MNDLNAVDIDAEAMSSSESSINMLDPASILAWSYQLVVTPIELKQAVATVGASITNVREYFGLSDADIWPFAANPSMDKGICQR